MNSVKPKSVLIVFAICCSVLIFSCRKKDRRYEGVYIGTERYIFADSGATEPSIDSTYDQEYEVTYDNAFLPRNKRYNFSFSSDGIEHFWSISKNQIEDGLYQNMYDGGSVKFFDDSIQINFSNFSDYMDVWDIETWEFRGKRN
ncbi:MAG: hypothetical protein ABJG68_07675 [Crocinitomicaceae bacterium]